MRPFLVTVFALATWSCREAPAADVATDTGTDTAAPYCHYDCFGYAECNNGRVTVWASSPVPCAVWTGRCPIARTIDCAKGCRIDGVSRFDRLDREPRELCEEWRPRKAGDVCTTEADCLPTPGVVTDAGVMNTYLRCNADTGRCEDAPPPVVSDWLAPCPTSATSPSSGEYGYVAAPECSMGVCLVYNDGTTCMYQGCTKPCVADHECPPGSLCGTYLDNLGTPIDDAGITVGVCKPGPPNVIGVGLRCPPTSDAGADG